MRVYKIFNLLAIMFFWVSSIIISITYSESIMKNSSRPVTYKNVTEVHYPHFDSEWMSEINSDIAMLTIQLQFLLEKSKNEIQFENQK